MTTEFALSKWVRPTMLASVAFMCFGIAIITGLLEGFGFSGLKFGIAVMEIMSKVPDNLFSLFELMFFVYGIGRSGEKMVKYWKNPVKDEQTDIE